MKADVATVETALVALQLLVSKPSALFDPYAALAGWNTWLSPQERLEMKEPRGTLLSFASVVHWYTIQQCRAR